ncbi:hypothetical protein Tco_1121998 [Tanacetum coccineum]|uniref:Uncharacterized protein n=1 Tax=Tanacetum coccineum TaxID=301880 RepID=A0ABQ5J289_9ASTR
MEPDFSNMTLNEYLMYQGRNKDLERSCTSWKSVAPVRNRILVYPDSDEEDEEYYKEDSSLDEILDDLFKIGAENIRKMEHEVPNRYGDITDYEDSDQEDGSHSKEMESEVTSTRIHVPVQVDAHGMVLGLYLDTGKHFKSRLVGYHADDDDVL